MGLVHYDGVNDFILFGSPTAVLQAVPTGDKTFVTVVRREVAGAWGGLITMETSAAAAQTSLEYNNLNTVEFQDQTLTSHGSTAGPGTNITDYLLAAVTHTGVGIPRITIKNITTGAAVARENGHQAINQGATIGSGGLIRFGMWQGSDPLTGWQVVAAIFNGTLTDAQVDECWANKRTSDIWNNSFGRPVMLVEFNTLTPVDLTGNSTLSSVNAPSLDAAQTGAGWTFDGTGAVVDNTTKPSLPGQFDPQLRPNMWF